MRYLYEIEIQPKNIRGMYPIYIYDFDCSCEARCVRSALFAAAELIEQKLKEQTKAPIATFDHEPTVMGAKIIAVFVDVEAPKDSMTAKEAADELGVTIARVYGLLRQGILRAEKQGRDLHIDRASVEARKKAPKRLGRPPKAKQENH